MSGNQWQFLVDENVPKGVWTALRTAGYSAVRVVDVGLSAKPDTSVFAYARTKRLIIITQDTDFEDRARFPPPHVGILVLRNFPRGSSVLDRTDAVLKALASLTGQNLANRVYIIYPDGLQKKA